MAILTRHSTPEVSTHLAKIWHRIQVCLLPGVDECLEDELTQGSVKQTVLLPLPCSSFAP